VNPFALAPLPGSQTQADRAKGSITVRATSDDVAVYAARRVRLNRLRKLLEKRRRNRPAIGERTIDPPETGLFFDSEMYGERSTEIIFMSMMWMGM
jgi:hypothetical protein